MYDLDLGRDSNWMLIAYFVALVYLSIRREAGVQLQPLRKAWITFALLPFWQFLMYLFRAGASRNLGRLEIIAVWQKAVPCLLFGISLLYLMAAIVPRHPTSKPPSA